MIDGIGDRRGDADDADLADAFDTERIDDVVRFVDEDDLYVAMSAFTATWYSAMLAFMTRPNA